MMADDLGYGDTGFNGSTENQTPALDELASQGIIFSRFYSASPVCSPTRASCLTGRNPYRMNIPTANSGHMPESEITLAEILREHGYRTGHFGKWHLGIFTTNQKDANRGRPGNEQHLAVPTDHGFDSFFSTESKVPTWDPMIKPIQFDTTQGENLRFGWKALNETSDSVPYGTRYWTGLEEQYEGPLEGDDSGIIMDHAINFISKSLTDKSPFFSVIWFHAPHLPVVVDSSYRANYPDLPLRKQLYFGTISALDEQVGRLWDFLTLNEVANNTIIFFCSDNGPELRTPGSAGIFRGKKRDLYEGGIRVPAFCVWPDELQKDIRIDAPAFTSDYLPTLVDFLNIDFPDDRLLDGTSIKPLLLGNQTTRAVPMGFRFQNKLSWVTDRYKLISVDKGRSYELYDLIQDPQEKNNIISENKEQANQLITELEAWLATF